MVERFTTNGALDTRLVDALAGEALMALDGRGAIVRWNPGAEKLYGRAAHEATGLDLSLLYLPDEREMGSPRRELLDAELHGRDSRERWQCRADGSRFYAQVTTTALRGGNGLLEGFARHVADVTDQLRHEEALRRSEQRFHGIVNLASDAIVSVDEEQRVVLFNHGATNIFGYTADEMTGQPLSLLIPERQREPHARQLGAFAATGATARPMGARAEVRGVRRGGEEFPAEASISVMEDDQGRRLFTAMLRDVSARRAAEREIQRLLEAESEARGRAESALRARSDLLGVVAHDFGNALTAAGFHAFDLAESLQARGLEEERSRAGVILSMIEHLGRLQRDLIDSAALEAGRLSLFPMEMDVMPLLEKAGSLYEVSADSRHVHLRVEPAPGPLRVQADPDRFLQVLGNLLSNAIRFSPAQGTVTLAAERAGDTAVITVADEGPGIPAEDLDRVFEPFWRAGTDGGTGLGLAIARGIAAAQGGMLSVANRAGRGAVFTLTLPLAPALLENVPEASAPLASSITRSKSPAGRKSPDSGEPGPKPAPRG
ncbi:MAG TPA: PAS domain S-box protein [Longimicrobium sp.]|nr:PAS domain S-box protein [Longimicrobium sp.]